MLRLVIGGLRVQEVRHRDGTIAFTIVGPDRRVHPEAERFLTRYAGAGTDRTYAGGLQIWPVPSTVAADAEYGFWDVSQGEDRAR